MYSPGSYPPRGSGPGYPVGAGGYGAGGPAPGYLPPTGAGFGGPNGPYSGGPPPGPYGGGPPPPPGKVYAGPGMSGQASLEALFSGGPSAPGGGRAAPTPPSQAPYGAQRAPAGYPGPIPYGPPPPGPYGGPSPGPYGAPGGPRSPVPGAGAYGAPMSPPYGGGPMPSPYGAPPGAYGAPPGAYGAPPPGHYGVTPGADLGPYGGYPSAGVRRTTGDSSQGPRGGYESVRLGGYGGAPAPASAADSAPTADVYRDGSDPLMLQGGNHKRRSNGASMRRATQEPQQLQRPMPPLPQQQMQPTSMNGGGGGGGYGGGPGAYPPPGSRPGMNGSPGGRSGPGGVRASAPAAPAAPAPEPPRTSGGILHDLFAEPLFPASGGASGGGNGGSSGGSGGRRPDNVRASLDRTKRQNGAPPAASRQSVQAGYDPYAPAEPQQQQQHGGPGASAHGGGGGSAGVFSVGCVVVRGPDWDWVDQDGGRGRRGVIVAVGCGEEPYRPSDWAKVKWEASGVEADYRTGADGKQDLEIYLSAPPAISEGCIVKKGRDWRGPADPAQNPFAPAPGGKTGAGHSSNSNGSFFSLFAMSPPPAKPQTREESRGPATAGVVTRVHNDGSVDVRWRGGAAGRYAFGAQGRYEVALDHVPATDDSALIRPLLVGARVQLAHAFKKNFAANQGGAAVGAGTVTSLGAGADEGYVNVVWDSRPGPGRFRWGAEGEFDLDVLTIPSLSGARPALPVGATVTRSGDWVPSANDPRGRGTFGEVLQPIKGMGAGYVAVKWEGGETTEAKWGAGGVHEVDVVRLPKASAPYDTQCDVCGGSVGYKGRMHWHCEVCRHFDLCVECQAAQRGDVRSLHSSETHSADHKLTARSPRDAPANADVPPKRPRAPRYPRSHAPVAVTRARKAGGVGSGAAGGGLGGLWNRLTDMDQRAQWILCALVGYMGIKIMSGDGASGGRMKLRRGRKAGPPRPAAGTGAPAPEPAQPAGRGNWLGAVRPKK